MTAKKTSICRISIEWPRPSQGIVPESFNPAKRSVSIFDLERGERLRYSPS
jgi:hypothetical protein